MSKWSRFRGARFTCLPSQPTCLRRIKLSLAGWLVQYNIFGSLLWQGDSDKHHLGWSSGAFGQQNRLWRWEYEWDSSHVHSFRRINLSHLYPTKIHFESYRTTSVCAQQVDAQLLCDRLIGLCSFGSRNFFRHSIEWYHVADEWTLSQGIRHCPFRSTYVVKWLPQITWETRICYERGTTAVSWEIIIPELLFC